MLELRLKDIRKHFNLSQSDMVDKLKIALRAYQMYEQGRSSPPDDVKCDIATQFNINLHWLLTGSGSMFVDSPPDTGIHCPNCGSKLKVTIDKE